MQHGLACLGRLRIFLDHLRIGGKGFGHRLHGHLGVGFLKQCLWRKACARISLEQSVDLLHLGAVAFAESCHHGFLEHGVVGCALVLAYGLAVALLGCREVLGVVVGVANAVVGIGQQLLAKSLGVDGVLERLFGCVVAFLLEKRVAQVVLRQTVVLVGGGSGVDIGELVVHGFLVVATAILCLAEPQLALVQYFLVVVAHGNGLFEIVLCRFGLVVCQCLHTQVVEHFLLGGEHLLAGVLNV